MPSAFPASCVLAEQLGRRLAPSVLVDVAVAARVVAAAPDRVRTAWLDRLLDGTAPVSLAMAEPASRRIASRRTRRAASDVSGTKLGVQHGNAVAAFGVRRVARRRVRRSSSFARTAPASRSRPSTALDPTACAARLVLDDVAVGARLGRRRTPTRSSALSPWARSRRRPRRSAPRPLRWISRSRYAKEREQFGRPIGAFQAVQHILADAHVLRETAWSAVLYAAAALDEETPDAAEATTIAKAYVSRAARTVVEGALQVFGGIGFTWEHDLHLFLRRVLACEQRFGDALFHERQLAASLASRAEDRLAASSGRRLR